MGVVDQSEQTVSGKAQPDQEKIAWNAREYLKVRIISFINFFIHSLSHSLPQQMHYGFLCSEHILAERSSMVSRRMRCLK